ncbi:ribonuclease inhibitor [bacterium]|nr:MAG: ribonuclease inhibitor [bacterium]
MVTGVFSFPLRGRRCWGDGGKIGFEMSPEISCPVVRVPSVVPCDVAELDELIAFLESDASADEVRAFARGTVLPDGRLDLCKQSVGPLGCARIVSALQGNSRIKSVLLGTDAIGDEGAFEVARLIEANPRLEVVYLGCNGITERGVGELARVLKENNSVKGLWLKRNPIGNGGMKALGDMLSHNTTLEILDVVNCGFGDSGFSEVCEALGQSNRSLKRLYIGGNGELSSWALAEMLSQSTSLEGLYLNVGALGDTGAWEVARGVKRSSSLRELGVGSNGIGLEGLKALCVALSEHATVESVDMGRAASQTVLGAKANDFSGGGPLVADMLRVNKTLRRLNLRGTKLGMADFAAIFGAASSHPTLSELMVDSPLSGEVKARLALNWAALPAQSESGVQLIRSVYRTAKTEA